MVTHYELLGAIRKYRAGGPGIKSTLMVMAEYAGIFEEGGDWSCCPGQDRIALESEQSVRTVRNHIRDLEELGVIVTRYRNDGNGHRTSSLYVFNLEALGLEANVAGRDDRLPANGDTPTGTLLPVNSQREEPERTDTPLCPPRGATDDLGFPTAAAIRTGTPYPAAFEAFWCAYPRRLNKTGAYKAWVARLREGRRGGVPVERRAAKMVEAAENYARSVLGKELEYVKYAATFLGPAEPWKDYALTAVPEAAARRSRYVPPAVGT